MPAASRRAEDLTQTSWPTGQVKTASRGDLTRTSNYNRRGLLTFETLTIDGTPYEIDTAYNARGQPAFLTYPDASSVDYAPNAFGDPSEQRATERARAGRPRREGLRGALHGKVHGLTVTGTDRGQAILGAGVEDLEHRPARQPLVADQHTRDEFG